MTLIQHDKNSVMTGLAAGTLVTTPDGDKKIEEIKTGDLVLSGIGEGKTGFHEVKKVMSNPFRGPLLRIVTGAGYQFRASSNQGCFAFPDGDKPQEDSVHLRLFFAPTDEFKHLVTTGGELERHFEIDDAENWARHCAVRGAEENDGDELNIERFAHFREHSIFRFLNAAELEVGMHIPVAKNFYADEKAVVEEARVKQIKRGHYDGLVYDLDIPTARNIAANGVLVHDSAFVPL
jgi:hypothetical protein